MSKSTQSICNVCSEEHKVRYREFSPHAWAALVTWGEIETKAIGQAMCDSCYGEIRELLIERSEEVAALAEAQGSKGTFPTLPDLPPFLGRASADAQIAS